MLWFDLLVFAADPLESHIVPRDVCGGHHIVKDKATRGCDQVRSDLHEKNTATNKIQVSQLISGAKRAHVEVFEVECVAE